jgi:hypothetical protein
MTSLSYLYERTNDMTTTCFFCIVLRLSTCSIIFNYMAIVINILFLAYHAVSSGILLHVSSPHIPLQSNSGIRVITGYLATILKAALRNIYT